MAQHDFLLAGDQSLASGWTDLNNAVEAIVTISSGASEPATIYPGMLWLDTSGTRKLLKQRDTGDTTWNIVAVCETPGGLLTYSGNPNGYVTGDYEGQQCYDTSGNLLYCCTSPGIAASAVWSNALQASFMPAGYNASSAPVYASSTTFTMAKIYCADSLSTSVISKATSTTVDIATTGLNGIAQSANLTGTITATTSSTAVVGVGTSFTSDFQAGDVVTTAGGQSRRIITVTDSLNMVVESAWTAATESGVAYKRGGRAASTWYNLYAVTNGSTPGLILSTRNAAGGDTLVDFPSGYTVYRQMPFSARLFSTGSLINFSVAEGWPTRPAIYLRAESSGSCGNTASYGSGDNRTGKFNVLALTSLSSYTQVSLAAFVPPVSRFAYMSAFTTSGTGYFALRAYGDSNDDISLSMGQLNSVQFAIPTSSAQVIEAKYLRTSTLALDVRGFVITEVS